MRKLKEKLSKKLNQAKKVELTTTARPMSGMPVQAQVGPSGITAITGVASITSGVLSATTNQIRNRI